MNLLPAQFDSAFAAFERAVDVAGSQSELARIVGCTPANVHQHLRARRLLPARFVLAVEAALGIPRYELRPDIYPPEEQVPAPQAQAQVPTAHPSASASHAPVPPGVDGTPPALDYPGADPLKGMAA